MHSKNEELMLLVKAALCDLLKSERKTTFKPPTHNSLKQQSL